MIKKYVPLALLGFLGIAGTSCGTKNKGFKKTASGLQYRIVKDSAGGQKAAIGDLIEFHFKQYVRTAGKDSMLVDSRVMRQDQPMKVPVSAPAFKGDPSEGFTMLSAGDSAVFRVSVDTLVKAGFSQEPWMQLGKGQTVDFAMKVVKVHSQANQASTDEQLLRKYFSDNNINPQKTASGLYYKIDNPGSGANPQPGQMVSVNYTGRTLDGKPFDSNVDPQFNHKEPLKFPIGQGQVIPGWDEGIALLKKGGKGTLYIPSNLAYGPNSPSPLLPPNSVLVFEVELLDILAAAQQAPVQ